MSPNVSPPDFDEWESPDSLLTDGPIRERLLDVVVQLREPTTVSTVAERADCDTETARDYLEWFATAGIVREHEGRPVRYERNESYLRWRRIEAIRREYTETELVAELEGAIERLREYRERFDAERPADVSLLGIDETDERPLADVWEELSQWQTLRRRAELLDAARREEFTGKGSSRRIDA